LNTGLNSFIFSTIGVKFLLLTFAYHTSLE